MEAVGLRNRVLVAVGAAVVLLGGAFGYAVAARNPAPASGGSGAVSLDPGHRLLVVHQRQLATVATGDPAGPKLVSGVSCVRAYAASGTGICLREDSPWSYSVHVLDRQLHDGVGFRIPGLPSRARVSPSGRLVTWTTFVGGEAYNKGGFSTRTGILDTRTGAREMNLESFSVVRDGRPYHAADVNFWGVTFAADDNRFYATMATDGRRYLVEGDLASRSVRTVAENVECPSLSPDGTRIAFKRAIDGDPTRGWRLSALDLATLTVTPLAEPRSIDDQPAWLDDTTIAYTVRDSSGAPSVWLTAADGTGHPQLLVRDAESPAALSGSVS